MPFRKPTESSLDPEIAALLRSRRAMFEESPSVLGDVHRRIRASAMRRVSVREALAARVSNWIEDHLSLQTGLRYAGAAALAVAVAVVALNQGSGDQASAPVLTLASPSATSASPTLSLGTAGGRADYAMNDVQPASSLSGSLGLDQQIDRSTVGGDLNASSNAQYILPKAPSTYDSVVAF